MRHRCIVAVGAWLLAPILGCAASPAPAPAHRTESAQAMPLAAPEPLDLSLVSRPIAVVAVDRFARPQALLETEPYAGSFERWGDLPCLESWQDWLEPSAAVDQVAVLDERAWGPMPEFQWVISLGLRDPAAALGDGQVCGAHARRERAGLRRLVTGGDDDEGLDARTCVVAASLGPTPARLVCGPRGAVDLLWPYLARGLAAEPAPESDRHAELAFAPIHAQYGERFSRLAQIARPGALRALSDIDPDLVAAVEPSVDSALVEALALVGDQDLLRFDSQRTNAGLQGLLELRFRSQESWTVRTLLEYGRRSQGVPPWFWDLPADAEGAWFTSEVPGESYAETFGWLGDVLTRYYQGTPVDRKTAELIVETFLPARPFVWAHGAVKVDLPEQCSPVHIRNAGIAATGWHLIGFGRRSPDYRQRLVRAMKAYNDGVLRWFVYRRSNLCQGLPNFRIRRGPLRELPRGSTVFEMRIPGRVIDECYGAPLRGVARAKPLTYVVALVESEDRTFIGISADENVLFEKLNVAIGRRPNAETLKDRPGLEPLRQGRPFVGGFLTRNGLAGLLAAKELVTQGGPYRDRRVAETESRAPLTIALSADPGESTATLRVRVPEGMSEAKLEPAEAGACASEDEAPDE